jgi:hypothetical protein
LTQVFLSPNSAAQTAASASAGPLLIGFEAPNGPLHDLIASTFSLYDVSWANLPMRRVELSCAIGGAKAAGALGSYLECAQMLVDTTPDGLRATTTHGGVISATFAEDGEQWSMGVSEEIVSGGMWPEVEDMLSLVLTTGWRRAGWVPLHAGGLTDGAQGLLVCAGSGGGKTTFTLAMARRGWRALGDDKLLLAMNGRPQYVAAIKHMFNVDPAVGMWFPEVGDLGALPQYSAGTPKRRVSLRSFWPMAPATEMAATHLLTIERRPDEHGIGISVMTTADAISTLLHQSVIPRDPSIAGPIARSLAMLGQRVSALRVTVGDDAYLDPDALLAVEESVR